MICGGVVCALHVKTAGLTGQALGSDEEEIIYIAFVIIDVVTNKVIGEQQYAVRPRKSTEEIQTGQPLEVVIAQFDMYLRSIQVDPNSPLFRLVTDGQTPLRQCLHRECSMKDILLPSYYCRFHDVRKEFVRAYTLRAVTAGQQSVTPAPDVPQTLHDMLNYLGLSAYDGDNIYAAEVKELANIVQKIITDGYRLELPETVDMILEPGICSKDDDIDGNCIVRARGLPWQSSDQDIAKFFRGLNVAKGGVALCLSAQGRRNGEALIRFISQEHRDLALKRHKHHIGNRYIEVYRASGEDFLAVAGGASCEAAAFLSRAAAVIIRMRGLPYDATSHQVCEFFTCGDDGVDILDGTDGVLFVRKADGRATGDAFVAFPREADSSKALKRHRNLIGTRYIELFRSTSAEVQQVLNRALDTRQTNQQPTITVASPPSVPPPTVMLPTNNLLSAVPSITIPEPPTYQFPGAHLTQAPPARDCIRLRGLPYEAQVEHILSFLDEFAKHILCQGVHMVISPQGVPSGEAFIQMENEAIAGACAAAKHCRVMSFGKKQRYIEVFQCSADDMSLFLSGAAASPPPGMLYSAAGAFYPSSPPPPYHVLVWGYPTPPVSPAHYYHTHHPMVTPEGIQVNGGSPLPMSRPPSCTTEWPPVFMVN